MLLQIELPQIAFTGTTGAVCRSGAFEKLISGSKEKLRDWNFGGAAAVGPAVTSIVVTFDLKL